MSLTRRSLLGFLAAAPIAPLALATSTKIEARPLAAANPLSQFRRALSKAPEPQGLTMSLADFHARIVEPAMRELAEGVWI